MLFTIGFNAILGTKVGNKFLFVYNEQIKENIYIYLYYYILQRGERTLFGFFFAGFAANQFNWGSGNENLGNEVVIVSGTQSYKTEIHKDGCTENQIQFYTPYVFEYLMKISISFFFIFAFLKKKSMN